MLEHLFKSRVRIKILQKYLLAPGVPRFHVRFLVRELDEEINAIRRELQNLEEANLLISEKAGNRLLYIINKNHILYYPLRTLFLYNHPDIVKVKTILQDLQHISLCILTKHFLNQKYKDAEDIDILIVGTESLTTIQKIIAKLERHLKRELRVTYLSDQDLKFHLKKQSTFLLNILNKDKIFVIGDETKLYK